VALPWVRLDSNISSHDKILELVNGTSQHRWRAAAVYQFAIGWCGGQGTDGHIPFTSLTAVHGSKAVAELLVSVGLWAPDPHGWHMPNWRGRQPTSDATEAVRAAQSKGAMKANCVRWHGPKCGCWEAL
jgi:hypothetical protein